MPSMLALLGLAAFAGYQNRDKIAAALKDAQARRDTPGAPQSGLDGILAGVGDLVGNAGQGGGNILSGGLGDLLTSFRSAGHGAVADSWVKPGPNQGLTPDQVEQAIGRDNLAELSQRTGLSHEELLKRLATSIPETVDRLTPNGQMPTEDQARQLI
jgi:uncharacterized protein YidB (DUF937 family)